MLDTPDEAQANPDSTRLIEAAREARDDAAPSALTAAGALVLLALVGRHAGWELLGHQLWWIWVVVAFPYMLSPGKHSTRDIPRMVAEVAKDFPNVTYRVTEAFGVSAQLCEVIAQRAAVDIAHPATDADACRCWDPSGRVGECGAACTGKVAESIA